MKRENDNKNYINLLKFEVFSLYLYIPILKYNGKSGMITEICFRRQDMLKIKVFLNRIATGSFKRFFRNLEIVHQESGKNRLVLLFDMIYCMFAYEIGYLDYLTFGFAYIKGDKRKTFMTMSDNISLTRKMNQREAYDVFDDKILFYNTFKEYLGREFMDLREGNIQEFTDFCHGKECIFAKVPVSFGGSGVRKIALAGQNLENLYHELLENGMYLVEDAIRQHPEMCKLCARSVNTVRIVTVISDKGNPNLVYSLVRIGSGDNDVDNICSGGMYTLLSSKGEITHPAFCDRTVTYYEQHPANGLPFIGFCIPYFREAGELCKKAALKEPRMRYIGWDVAITPDGPVLVEGNNLPGYDMCQNHRFHDDGCGIRPAFEAAIQN